MNHAKKIYLAVDTSYEQGVVVLFSEQGIIFEAVLKEKLAHGRLLSQALIDALAVVKSEGFVLEGLLVGLGPGSFVGMRIALATMMGVAKARRLPLMGFCSHLALGFSVGPDLERFLIFMKAAGDKGYATDFALSDGVLCKMATKVMSSADIAGFEGNAIFSDQASLGALGLVPHHLAGPSALGLMRAAKEAMKNGIVDEANFIKPNYIKNPDVSLPKKSFVINSRGRELASTKNLPYDEDCRR